ncbi:MAG: hypothetical protein LKF58_03220 [Bacilli bacterium]|jgi:hypothetical protein|nr:hypothetical protein [Bacilli bacterium]MCH4210765.1 hypothetical protein [Bacilli bacterium]MCH4277961.1 hypothetical protein [Bacilli bacterium]MCI2055356.1 hypothetical protein [Bacilli bacterium]
MKHGPVYRFFMILLAYIIFGLVIILSLGSGSLPMWVFYLIIGLLVAAFIITEVANEYVIYKRSKDKPNQE